MRLMFSIYRDNNLILEESQQCAIAHITFIFIRISEWNYIYELLLLLSLIKQIIVIYYNREKNYKNFN